MMLVEWIPIWYRPSGGINEKYLCFILHLMHIVLHWNIHNGILAFSKLPNAPIIYEIIIGLHVYRYEYHYNDLAYTVLSQT